MKRLAVAVIAVGLSAGYAPSAHAGTTLRGSIAGSGDPGLCYDAQCAAFTEAGCPTALANADGVTASIVNVESLRGSTRTFSWADTSTRLHDANPTVGERLQTQIEFYVLDSCDTPPNGWAFSMTSLPSERTFTYTFSKNAKWLIVEPRYGASNVTWTAS